MRYYRRLHRRKFNYRMLYLIPVICLSLALIVTLLVYYHPRFVIYLLSKYYSDVLFDVDLPSHLRSIALTIDDFPNRNDLSISFRLLDLLRSYDARCTFFLIGSHVQNYRNSSEMQTLFQRLESDGHEIGNHGWRDEEAIRLSEGELQQQILDTEQIIVKYTNSSQKKWFRPGSGFFNRAMIRLCTKLGYRLVLGSIYPFDPQMPYPRLNSRFIQSKLYSGAIVILHDRFVTIETLERVLPAIQRRNFRILTLTQLMDLKTKPNHSI